MKTYKYTIPTWAVVTLAYGEVSHLDSSDQEAVFRFETETTRDHGYGHWEFPDDIDSSSYFTAYNDVTGSTGACNCVDVYLIVME